MSEFTNQRTGEPSQQRPRVRSGKTPMFNVATPPWGGCTHTFEEPGVYNVTFDIHVTMRATIHVASTPYVGTADERGRFTVDSVVPVTYKLAGFRRDTD